MKLFFISSDINKSMAMELTAFFIECKLQTKKAVIIINTKSGSDSALKQIVAAYQSSGVYLIAIGMGQLHNCSSAIFCMADERILLPETEFSIHPNLKDYYGKTAITQEELHQKCTNKTCWELSKEDIGKYNITTRPFEGWMDLVIQAMEEEENEFSNYFSFTSKFTSDTAASLILFLIKCKMHKKDAFVVINSGGGIIPQLKAILNVYQDSGVHLTAIGTGVVGSCAAALFCMADERILAPGTELLLHHSSITLEKRTTLPFSILKREYEWLQKSEKILVDAYTTKTNIPMEVFEAKCENGADWVLTEDEIQKYGITTPSSESWIDILAKAIKQDV